MPYAGKTLMQREGVALVAKHWPNQKTKATAVLAAEARFSIGAWHDNVHAGDEGLIDSRDCGLFQINIPGRDIGTHAEEILRTEALDPMEYMPVAVKNVQRAYELWNSPMRRPAGQPQKRLWQPWVAYTTGWAMFPEAWVWSQIQDGVPGPWVPTGRYLHQAIRAVANWHLFINKSLDEQEALAEAERLAAQYGITKGNLTYSIYKGVYWVYPPKPTEPPADGRGKWPIPNDGI